MLTYLRLSGALAFLSAAALTVFALAPSNHGLTTSSSVSEASLYESQVQPIFSARCIACHSCNTAPCQLNFTNYDGALRGASKTPINQPFKQSPAHPTRLGIDAQTEQGWRALGFFSVTQREDGERSNLSEALNLKAQNPTAPVLKKAESAKTCPAKPSEWKSFAKAHAEMGMPYGLPALTSSELSTIEDWMKAGSPGPNSQEQRRLTSATNETGRAVIARIEAFLNEPSLKSKIVARYLYEHLFLAHLHFENEMPKEFFRLTRSRTKCEAGVDEIASVRPYDDPGVERFWYCLRKHDQAVTEKNHIVYEMSEAKLSRWRELFFSHDWKATRLPSYEMRAAANPFETFKELPAEARYRWLLDDSQYSVMTFIKGSVCRGHTAVNVIDEQFHILFLDPKADHFVNNREYADRVSPYLKMPDAYGSNVKFIKLSTKIVPFIMSELKNKRNAYRALRDQQYAIDRPNGYSVDDIWNGDGANPNAILTVLRHFDSAQVVKGAWGGDPKTSWVMDYPLFERLVYDLVAGYDVYGTMGHQVLTRIYMHFIRMENEENFLSFLPPDSREPLRSYWYRDAPDVNKRYPLNPGTNVISPTAVSYEPRAREPNLASWNEAKREFLEQVYETRFNAKVLGVRDAINDDPIVGLAKEKISTIKEFESELRKIVKQPAIQLPFSGYLDDTALLHVIVDGGRSDRVYTLVRNKEHFNIASILGERGRRDPANDSFIVMPGYVASYPNRFFVVDLKNAGSFLRSMQAIRSQASARDFIARYGIARQDPTFWTNYDWFVKHFAQTEPTQAGAIDLIRYGNAEPLPEDDENADD